MTPKTMTEVTEEVEEEARTPVSRFHGATANWERKLGPSRSREFDLVRSPRVSHSPMMSPQLRSSRFTQSPQVLPKQVASPRPVVKPTRSEGSISRSVAKPTRVPSVSEMESPRPSPGKSRLSDKSPRAVAVSDEEVEEKIGELLDEFVAEGDAKESVESIVELNAPHMHNKIIELGILKTLEKSPEKRELMKKLFAELRDRKIVKEEDWQKG